MISEDELSEHFGGPRHWPAALRFWCSQTEREPPLLYIDLFVAQHRPIMPGTTDTSPFPGDAVQEMWDWVNMTPIRYWWLDKCAWVSATGWYKANGSPENAAAKVMGRFIHRPDEVAELRIPPRDRDDPYLLLLQAWAQGMTLDWFRECGLDVTDAELAEGLRRLVSADWNRFRAGFRWIKYTGSLDLDAKSMLGRMQRAEDLRLDPYKAKPSEIQSAIADMQFPAAFRKSCRERRDGSFDPYRHSRYFRRPKICHVPEEGRNKFRMLSRYTHAEKR